MTYLEISLSHSLKEPQLEVLMAQLGEIGFESFVENDQILQGYIQEKDYNLQALQTLLNDFWNDEKISFEAKKIEEQNWNAVWESNYSPVQFDDFCYVRAPFHEPISGVRFNLLIEPKMSFGTAHHETTSLMVEWLKTENVEGKTVLDMGCGTGLLAILAKKLGASDVTAIDNDPWAYENSVENCERNDTPEIHVELGDAENLKGRNFEVIIANINRNILLNDIPAYAACLPKGGVLLLSGFYTEDLPAITERCKEFQLQYANHLTKNNWVAAKFVK